MLLSSLPRRWRAIRPILAEPLPAIGLLVSVAVLICLAALALALLLPEADRLRTLEKAARWAGLGLQLASLTTVAIGIKNLRRDFVNALWLRRLTAAWRSADLPERLAVVAADLIGVTLSAEASVRDQSEPLEDRVSRRIERELQALRDQVEKDLQNVRGDIDRRVGEGRRHARVRFARSIRSSEICPLSASHTNVAPKRVCFQLRRKFTAELTGEAQDPCGKAWCSRRALALKAVREP